MVITSLQRMAYNAHCLQHMMWDRTCGICPDFGTMSISVEAAPSTRHGTGLFACENMDKHTVASLYPVHCVGNEKECITASDDNAAHFQSTYMHLLSSVMQRDDPTSSYKLDLSHKSLKDAGLGSLWVDANPALSPVPGWMAHLANDAAMTSGGTEREILDYYQSCGREANAVLVPFGDAPPLMAIMTTRAVAADEELLLTYGHDYWLSRGGGTVPAYTEAVLRAADKTWKQASRDAIAAQPARYAVGIALLEAVMEADLEEEVFGED